VTEGVSTTWKWIRVRVEPPAGQCGVSRPKAVVRPSSIPRLDDGRFHPLDLRYAGGQQAYVAVRYGSWLATVPGTTAVYDLLALAHPWRRIA
jgi:hypothetical protein